MAGDEAVGSPHGARVHSLVSRFFVSRGCRLPCRAQPHPARIAQAGRLGSALRSQPPRSPGRTIADREDVFLRPNENKSAGGRGGPAGVRREGSATEAIVGQPGSALHPGTAVAVAVAVVRLP
jgi:hypothetical protein